MSKPKGRGRTATQAIAEGMKHIGVPYAWGGGSWSSGVDCSHFVCLCYDMGFLATKQMVNTNILENRDFKRYSYSGTSAKEGDILVYDGHTGIKVKTGELQAYGGPGFAGQGGKVGILGNHSAPWTTIWRPLEGVGVYITKVS